MVKKRKRRKRKVKTETITVEPENWKDKAPFKYFFNIFNISGLAIDGLASLLTVIFIVGIFLMAPLIWWNELSSGITVGGFFNSIGLTLIIWVLGGFLIEEFEGIKGMVYIFFIIIVGGTIWVVYDHYKYRSCVDNFRERPYTFDKIKFIKCGMIKEEKAYGKSEQQVRNEMIYYYRNNKY